MSNKIIIWPKLACYIRSFIKRRVFSNPRWLSRYKWSHRKSKMRWYWLANASTTNEKQIEEKHFYLIINVSKSFVTNPRRSEVIHGYSDHSMPSTQRNRTFNLYYQNIFTPSRTLDFLLERCYDFQEFLVLKTWCQIEQLTFTNFQRTWYYKHLHSDKYIWVHIYYNPIKRIISFIEYNKTYFANWLDASSRASRVANAPPRLWPVT